MVSLKWDEDEAKKFYESEARAEGRAEGKAEGMTEAIRSLMQTTGWAIEKVMEALKIPEVEWEKYKTAVQR